MFTNQTEIIKHSFLQSSFPPQVLVKHHVPVCIPFTLNTAPVFGSIPTREGEGQEHPEQAGERHEAWIPLHKSV